MAQYTKTEIESLDLIGPFGPFGNVSGNSNFNLDNLDLIGPFGPYWAIAPSSSTPTFDATKMFMFF